MISNWIKKSTSPVIYILSGMILGITMLAIQSFSERDSTDIMTSGRTVQLAEA